MTSLTPDQEAKLRRLFSPGLCRGLGNNPEQTCIEGALCLVLYGDLSDRHRGMYDCRLEAVLSASIILNDAGWSSPEARAQGLWDLALAQVGSAGLDEARIARRYVELTIRQVLPIALRAAGLEAEAKRCEEEGTEESARAAQEAALTVVLTAVGEAVIVAAAARAAAGLAARAAAIAANDAAYAAIDGGVDGGERDRILTLSASLLVQSINEARA